MFENIIEQTAVSQIQDDIKNNSLAQSMLFFGPAGSGKGSASLELARVLSCIENAGWKCACSSCERHRYLLHDDLLVLGSKNFYAEIAAFSSVFLRNPSQNTKLLFYRSLRKLQIRFSPFITEDDTKISKLSSLIQAFDEKMSDLFALETAESEKTSIESIEKLCNALLKDALALEEEGISSNIPIGHIRRASYWCRLAPSGKRKILVIENADRMRDEARNSLLKMLEEPPPAVSIVLTAARKESIIPTILSRLRPYRFLLRSIEGEKEVLRRVFQSADFNPSGISHNSLISAYLDSFLPASAEKLYQLAQWFVSQDHSSYNNQIVKALMSKSNNFENDSFIRFLKICLELKSENLKKNQEDFGYIRYYELYKKYIYETVTAVDLLNQSELIALEALIYKLKNIN